ncbi:DUF6339 family protein [Weissella cibaria]|uniref:DUF6339 family protein n=1 Tax=Weissella cibaria TaxID=137591 RepID=UPI003D35B66C
MAKVKLLKAEAVLEMEDNFLDYYNNPESLEVFMKENSVETGIDFEVPSLNPHDDFESAKALYKSLQMLTTVQAADERLWIYLFHTEFNDYRIQRLEYQYSNKEQKEKTLKSNTLFTGNNNDKIRAKFLNYLSRLWWAGYFSDSSEERLKLITQVDFSGIMTSYFSSTLTSLPEVRQGTLSAVNRFVSDAEDDVDLKQIISRVDPNFYGRGIRNLLIEANRYLNRKSSAVILDVYSKFEIADMVYRDLNERYKR